MSSSRDPEPVTAAGRPERAPWSLAARLTAWYAGSAFLLLLVATGFLYWVLVRNFEDEEDQYLTEKINVVQTLLRDRAGDATVLEWEVQEESTTRPFVRVLVRVLGARNRLVAETRGMAELLPPSAFRQAPTLTSKLGRGVEVRPGGRDFRILSARTSGDPSERENYWIQVALDRTYEVNLVAGYRRRLWLVLGLGLVVCAVAGYGIARRGIRPVEEIAATMRRTGSTTLNERIEPEGLPSELSALAATFNEMLDRLEDAFARLSRFSADIAHELRTPINNLRGEMEVGLAKARTPEEYCEVLGSSLEECVRLSRLIDRLLFLARAESPETHINREPLDVARELTALREFYEAAAGEAGVALELNVSSGVTAELDRTLFQRAVGNLVENALAHTPRGGAVKLTAAQENGNLRIQVADTGCGIPADHLSHVFDRFHRVDRARSKHSGGVGLGLAIVSSITHLHGGTAHIESEVGRGTRVTLTFPLEMTKS
ncbi:MAG: heavy metal sensor histidine kinase [Acidobacteria bacterium]|nr:heavy metal sensor histidine kinase [Acidobacteriota bacterium]